MSDASHKNYIVRRLNERQEKLAFFGQAARIAGEISTVPKQIGKILRESYHTGAAKHLIPASNMVKRFKVKRGGKEVWLTQDNLTKAELKKMRRGRLSRAEKSGREEYVEKKMREAEGRKDPNDISDLPAPTPKDKKSKSKPWSDARIAGTVGTGLVGTGVLAGGGAMAYGKYKKDRASDSSR